VVSNVAVVLDFKVLPQEPASSHFGIPFRQDPGFEDLLLEFHRIGLTILRHDHPGNPPAAGNLLNQLNFDMDHCSAHFPFGSLLALLVLLREQCLTHFTLSHRQSFDTRPL